MKRKRSEIKYVDLESISKHLYCAICNDVLNDPRRLSCGHTFCFICIKLWLNKKSLCPECRKPIKQFEYKQDLIPKKIIEDFLVYCKHNSCKWKGPLGLLNAHLAKECELEKIKKKSIENELKSKELIEIIDDSPVFEIKDSNTRKNTNIIDYNKVASFLSLFSIYRV